MNAVVASPATPERPRKGLTLRQERFCAEYMIDGNATKAAIRAGFSERSAGQLAHMLLRIPHVAAEVERLRAEARMGQNLTIERVQKEIARLAFADIRKLYREDGSLKSIPELDEDSAAAVAGTEVFEEFEGRGAEREQIGVTKKLKLWDKGRALELAAKHLGMVRDTPASAIGQLFIVIHK